MTGHFLSSSPIGFLEGKKRVLPFMETKSILHLNMDGWNAQFSLWDFEWIFSYFQGWTVSFTGKNGVRFHRGSMNPPVEASRMLGWTEYDQKRARASGGILVGVVVLVVIFFKWSPDLLNAFMKLVLSWVSMISVVLMHSCNLCFVFYSLSLHKRVRACFFTPSIITFWSS